MNGFFITGTDTGVGKTIVTSGLALSLQAKAFDLGIMKPIETGCNPLAEDAFFYKKLLDLPDSLHTISPIQLKFPLNPLASSEIEKKEIPLNIILDVYGKLQKNNQIVLVESTGGLLEPIKEDFLMAHLALIMDLPIILVVGNKRGAINHTLLTLYYARNFGLQIIAVIINSISKDAGTTEEVNIAVLQKMITDIPVFETPFIPNPEFQSSYHKRFDRIIEAIF